MNEIEYRNRLSKKLKRAQFFDVELEYLNQQETECISVKYKITTDGEDSASEHQEADLLGPEPPCNG